MTNLEKVQEVFSTSFNVGVEELENLVYKGVSSWDSVGHMTLIANLEDCFDIMLDPEDIMDISSYTKCLEVLATKYNIIF